MTNERRYREDEVREIIGRATRQEEGEASALPGAGGLTLAEVRDIGREVGLEPAAIARAATALEARAARLPRRTSLGMRIGAIVQAEPGADPAGR